MTNAFDEAFAAASSAQRQASDSAASKAAQRALLNAQARTIAEPVLREAGRSVWETLVRVGLVGRHERRTVMLPDDNGGSNSDFGVTRDGYLVLDPHLRGRAGFADLLSRVSMLPANPRDEDLYGALSHVWVDHGGAVVFVQSGYTDGRMDDPIVTDIHARLAKSVVFLRAHPARVSLWKP